MDRPRLLVVEDRPSVLELMATILRRGYQVLTAPDGEAALAILGTTPLDVVLTDVRMPSMSGFEVLRAVQSRSPGTEVVMMTAYANVADAVAAIKLGAYDYVAKPLDADEIGLVVARAVEHRREAAGATPASGGAAAPPAGGPPEVSTGFRHAVEAARERASRDYLVKLMQAFRGNVTRAARQAGMTRESLYRVLRKYGVDPGAVREEPEPEPNGGEG